MNIERQIMSSLKLILILLASIALNIFCAAQEAQRNIPDVSKIRGFNYESAPTIGHNEMWLQYSSAETARDMDYAKRLNLDQVRVFLGYTAYLTNKPAFRSNLVDIIRVCHSRGIGVMAVVPYPREWSTNQADWPLAREYAADLINTIGNGKEPGLAFWDFTTSRDFRASSSRGTWQAPSRTEQGHAHHHRFHHRGRNGGDRRRSGGRALLSRLQFDAPSN